MKLLRLTLEGQYKSLKDQTFDFSGCTDNILAFIGLNGTGKSQLLELIAETFAYLERDYRKDFKTKKGLGFGVEIEYSLSQRYVDGDNNPSIFKIKINKKGHVTGKRLEDLYFNYLPDYIIGYSSGFNENLQRGFMKNAVQYYSVMRARSSHKNDLSVVSHKNDLSVTSHKNDLSVTSNEEEILKVNSKYVKSYPGIFSFDENYEGLLNESDTPVPSCIFLDYDCNALLMASLALLKTEKIDEIFADVKNRYIKRIVFKYDLSKVPFVEDNVRDIKQLIDISGSENVLPESDKLSDDDFEIYEIDYLAASIVFNLENATLVEKFREKFNSSPLSLFKKLYKIQLLGVKYWQIPDRKLLRNDSFFGNVKKPIKRKLPFQVVELILADSDDKIIDFNDLSDGEAQLIQTISAATIFKDELALFLYDEPETHFNPSWRTQFHKMLCNAIKSENNEKSGVQIILSTHSPFIVSSLKKENVMVFNRTDNETNMLPANSNTYGAAFDVLIKKYFGLNSLISKTAVDEIKSVIRDDQLSDTQKQEWIENNVGDSMEKAYLLRRLQSNVVAD